jgi:threonine aldolase
MGHGKLRMVTHLDYREVMHTYVLETSKIGLNE